MFFKLSLVVLLSIIQVPKPPTLAPIFRNEVIEIMSYYKEMGQKVRAYEALDLANHTNQPTVVIFFWPKTERVIMDTYITQEGIQIKIIAVPKDIPYPDEQSK